MPREALDKTNELLRRAGMNSDSWHLDLQVDQQVKPEAGFRDREAHEICVGVIAAGLHVRDKENPA